MPGLRIMHVQPRLVGSLQNWSGLNTPDGKSWLIDRTKSLGFNAIWFSPMNVTTNVVMKKHGETVTGSLYAIRDHFSLDDEFSAWPGASSKNSADKSHLRHFNQQAAEDGLTVMGDLVFNHIAADHPLVQQEENEIGAITRDVDSYQKIYNDGRLIGLSYNKQGNESLPGKPSPLDASKKDYFFKFVREENLRLSVPGAGEEEWNDAAKINYASPQAMEFFVYGTDEQKGYWKEVIDWHLDMGFTGFRCDVAYMVPPDVWSELIQYAHIQKPDVVFMAETLGGGDQILNLKNAVIEQNGTTRPAFDLTMLSTYWWDFKEDWIKHENAMMHDVALYGGAAFPDNHDTPTTVAEHFKQQFNYLSKSKRNKIVGNIALRNYAVAALISNSVYMQLGYEVCRRQTSVFSGSTDFEQWKKLIEARGKNNHPLNISRQIKAINDFKEELEAHHTVIDIENIRPVGEDGRVIRIDCALKHIEDRSNAGKLVLFINEKPECGPAKITREELTGSTNQNGEVMNRIILGDADAEEDHMYDVHEIAAYYTPLDPIPQKTFSLNKKNRKPSM